MRRLLLIAGIVILIAAVLSLSFAALQYLGYRHALDGSPGFYDRLRTGAAVFFGVGIALAAAGTVCLAVRFRL